MATIRRSGKGWQALIRKKQYQGQKAKTFSSKSQALLWANAVEGSLQKPAQLDQPPPQILKDAIDLFIDGPLQEHRSGYNAQYPLKVIPSVVVISTKESSGSGFVIGHYKGKTQIMTNSHVLNGARNHFKVPWVEHGIHNLPIL